MTLPVRRLAVALVLGAALVTSGCGNTKADRAAVVDGQVITERSVQDAMEQLNAMGPQQPYTPSSTLTALVRAPALLDYLAGLGFVASDSAARQIARDNGVSDPADSTIEVIRSSAAYSQATTAGQFGQAETNEVVDQLRGMDIVVNPRYGQFDPETVTVGVTTPDWIETPATPEQ